MALFVPKKETRLGKRVSYGVCSMLIGSQEDFYSCYPNHDQDNFAEIASFGVFDGHNGVSGYF